MLERLEGFKPTSTRLRAWPLNRLRTGSYRGAPCEIQTRGLWIDNPLLWVAKLTGLGGGGRNQTDLLPLARRLLSQKRPHDWLRLQDSNPHLSAEQAVALPLS